LQPKQLKLLTVSPVGYLGVPGIVPGWLVLVF